ncbi:MAG: cadherin repeat domain-containing protein, partial [Ekhidna sp.]|nr:cadherin repeat domain-containing protein [Ekhidna sp.]
VEGTGAITTAATLDFENNPNYTLTVSVSDGKLSATADITVNVTDVEENTATFSAVTPLQQNVSLNSTLSFEVSEKASWEIVLKMGSHTNTRVPSGLSTRRNVTFDRIGKWTITATKQGQPDVVFTVNVVPFAIVDAEIETSVTSVASRKSILIRWTGGPGPGAKVSFVVTRPSGSKAVGNSPSLSRRELDVEGYILTKIGTYNGELSYGGETIRFRVNVVAPDGWTRVRTNGTGIVNDNLSAFQALGLGRNRAIVLRTAEWELYELPESNTRPWRTNGSNRIGAPQCLGNWACNTAGLWPEGNTDFWVRAYPQFVQNVVSNIGGTSIIRQISVGSSFVFKVRGGSGDIRWRGDGFNLSTNTVSTTYNVPGTYVVVATDNITKETVSITVEVK